MSRGRLLQILLMLFVLVGLFLYRTFAPREPAYPLSPEAAEAVRGEEPQGERPALSQVGN